MIKSKRDITKGGIRKDVAFRFLQILILLFNIACEVVSLHEFYKIRR